LLSNKVYKSIIYHQKTVMWRLLELLECSHRKIMVGKQATHGKLMLSFAHTTDKFFCPHQKRNFVHGLLHRVYKLPK